MITSSPALRFGSHRLGAKLSCADTDGLLNFRNENFAVANLSRFRGAQNRIYGALRSVVGDHNLELYFREEVDGVFVSAINLTVTFLPSETFYFTQCHPFHADFGERFLHLLHFERFNDRLDFFHPRESRTRRLKRKVIALAQILVDCRKFCFYHFVHEWVEISGWFPSKSASNLFRGANQRGRIRQPLE